MPRLAIDMQSRQWILFGIAEIVQEAVMWFLPLSLTTMLCAYILKLSMVALLSQYNLGVIAKIMQNKLLQILIMNFSIPSHLTQTRMTMQVLSQFYEDSFE